MKAESLEQLKANPYERSEERTDSRNGFRNRDLTTRIGKITLAVSRHRNVPFKTMIFENYARSEASLVRLIGSVLIDQNDICQSVRAVFSKESYRKLMSTDVFATFHRIALEQTAFLAA